MRWGQLPRDARLEGSQNRVSTVVRECTASGKVASPSPPPHTHMQTRTLAVSHAQSGATGSATTGGTPCASSCSDLPLRVTGTPPFKLPPSRDPTPPPASPVSPDAADTLRGLPTGRVHRTWLLACALCVVGVRCPCPYLLAGFKLVPVSVPVGRRRRLCLALRLRLLPPLHTHPHPHSHRTSTSRRRSVPSALLNSCRTRHGRSAAHLPRARMRSTIVTPTRRRTLRRSGRHAWMGRTVLPSCGVQPYLHSGGAPEGPPRPGGSLSLRCQCQ